MSNGRGLWGQVSWGLLVAGAGVFLLLTTLGVIPGTFWLALLPFWPVLLIALGVRFMFERSIPALALLSPLLILGVMVYVAMAGPGPRTSDDWMPISIERAEGIERLRLTGDLHMAKVKLEGRAMAPGTLIEGRAAVDDERSANARLYDRGDEARIRLGDRRDHAVRVVGPWALGRDVWEMAVPTDLPLSIDLESAGTSGEFDLRSVDVRRIKLDGALNDLAIHLGKPTRDTRIEFEGAFHRIDLYVPADTRVYSGSDGFMNDISGRRKRPRNDDAAYRVFVEGAFNRVKVRSR
jgi:hypothetical protein